MSCNVKWYLTENVYSLTNGSLHEWAFVIFKTVCNLFELTYQLLAICFVAD